MEIADALISPFVEQLINSVVDIAERAGDFENQLEKMNMGLAHIKVILEANRNNNDNNSNNDDDDAKVNDQTIQSIQIALSRFRNLMYEADDVWTDCLIRKQYGSNGLFSHFFRLQTQKKIEGINQRIKETEDYFNKHFSVPGGGNRYADDEEPQSYRDQLPESDESEPDDGIFGVEDDVKKIKDWISLSSNCGDLYKIGIVGMGGLGKTTVAKMTLYDPDIRSRFDKKIMVTVSRTFQKKVILQSILQRLEDKPCAQLLQEASEKDMLSKIASLLKDRSYLIILDDIWHKVQDLTWWKDMLSALPKSTSKQSCIIITTRDDRVTSNIKVNQVHRPSRLSDDHSWSLFKKHAMRSIEKQGLQVREYDELGTKIVQKCRGLPLAIKTIGGLLGSTHSLRVWEDICKGFCKPNFTRENEVVMASLNLSYKVLPGHLKQCLLCFSVYPEDYVIPAASLIHWWIAEGFIRAKDEKTAIEMGFEYLSNLVSRCLVEVDDRHGHGTGRFYKCKMHDLVRDLTIIMANNEKLRRDSDQSEEDQSKQESIEARWFCCINETQAKSLKKSPRLRVLLMLSMDKTKLDKNLRSLTSLRVLDLSNNKLDEDSLKSLFSWIRVLKRLAYLNLSESARLKEVPHSICKLQNLQVLILTECTKLSKLSPSVTYLKRLIVLNLGACESLLYLRRGLARLTQLQELYGLGVNRQNRRSCQLIELQELRNLRVLHIKLSKDSEITEQECEVLSKHKKLKVLSIDFDRRGEERTDTLEMLNKLLPPVELRELNLRQYHHENLPAWVNPQGLRTLLHLRIENGNIAEFPTTTTYNSLERLYLNLLPYLQADWNELLGKMPSLCYAELSCCPNVRNFPGDPDSSPRIWRPPPGNK